MSARLGAAPPALDMVLNRRNLLGGFAATLTVLGLLGSALAQEPVRIGMIPDSGATRVSIDQKAPLQAYLTKALGRPVTLIIPTNYNATVEALGNGSLDFAYLGGLTYVKAHARYGAVPLVQRDIDTEFHAVFITQADSNIHDLADLKGATFAFGDINSTSGHLMPYRAMAQAGIDAEADLKWSRYSGSHAATVEMVAAGIANAGACDETVFHDLVETGKIDGTKVRIFYTTPAFVDYVWTAGKDVPPDLREKFAQAFLTLSPDHDAEVLGILRGKHFIRATEAEYDAIQEVATKLSMF